MDPIPQTPVAPNPADDVQKNKVLAAISYIFIVSLIVLLVKKDSPFAQFHAKQGFVLFIASLVCGFIPVLGWLLNIVVLVMAIIGIISAAQGKWYKMPLVSQLAEKINF
jgi:uncharacterized membrane protein